MAEDHVHKQEFSIRELSTSSVTLFPARANVIREIKDVILKVNHQLSHLQDPLRIDHLVAWRE